MGGVININIDLEQILIEIYYTDFAKFALFEKSDKTQHRIVLKNAEYS